MKEKIVKESTQLFFKYGIKSVSMDDIAKELRISKKTLYQYFEKKDELLMACIDSHDIDEKKILKQIQEDSTNAIDEMLKIAKYLERMLKQVSPTMLYDVQKYHKSAWEKMNKMHKEDMYEEILTNIERGIREGLYRKDFNSDIIAKIYVSTSLTCSDSELFLPEKYNMNDIVQTNINYHLHGIVSPEGFMILEKLKNK